MMKKIFLTLTLIATLVSSDLYVTLYVKSLHYQRDLNEKQMGALKGFEYRHNESWSFNYNTFINSFEVETEAISATFRHPLIIKGDIKAGIGFGGGFQRGYCIANNGRLGICEELGMEKNFTFMVLSAFYIENKDFIFDVNTNKSMLGLRLNYRLPFTK